MADKNLTIQIGGNSSGAVNAIQNVQNKLKGLDGSLATIGSGLGKFGGIFSGITAALAGGAAFGAVIDKTKEVAGEVLKLTKTMGITAEEASVLRIALDDAFLSVDDITAGTSRLTKQLLSNEDAFKKLGVKTRDNNGNYRDTLDIMLDVNSALSKLQEGTNQNVAGMSIYGKSWNEVRGLLKLNNEAMIEAKKRAEELHLIFGDDGLKSVKEYKMAMKDLDDVTESFKVRIGLNMLKPLTDLTIAFGEAGLAGSDFFFKISKAMASNVAQFKIGWADISRKANIIGTGQWWTQSGRDEMRAGLSASDAMYEWQMMNRSEKMGGFTTDLVKPKSRRPKKGTLPPGFNDKNSSSAAAKDRADEIRAQLELTIGKADKSDLEQKEMDIDARYAKLKKEFPQLKSLIDQARSTELYALYSAEVARLESEKDKVQKEFQADRDKLYKDAIAQVQIKGKLQEAEIQHQLVLNELAKQTGTITTAQALQNELELSSQLLAIQQQRMQDLSEMGPMAAEAWAQERAAIDSTLQKIVELQAVMQQGSGDVAAGWTKGVNDYVASLESGFEKAASLAMTTARSMEQSFSDLFFDAMQGKLQNMSDYVNAFMSAIQRQLANQLAQDATSGIISLVKAGASALAGGYGGGPEGTASFVGPPSSAMMTGHGGGMVTGYGIMPRLHSGGRIGRLGRDEVPAILQTGERVLSRAQNRAYEAGGGTTHVHNWTIQALDAASFAQFAKANRGTFGAVFNGLIQDNHAIRRAR
jgi:hypothetical protein